jgi:hypothetical protein
MSKIKIKSFFDEIKEKQNQIFGKLDNYIEKYNIDTSNSDCGIVQNIYDDILKYKTNEIVKETIVDINGGLYE